MNLPSLLVSAGLTAYGRNSYGPCPVCHAERRGRHDRRGAIALYAGGDQWKCCAHGCGVGGSAKAFAAAVRFGEIPGAGDPRWRELHEGSERPQEPRQRPPEREPTYPPPEEVAALWGACLPVDEASADERCGYWLNYRALPVTHLVRSMPSGTVAYEWVPESAWSTHPVVVPLYDRDGALRSLRWRAVVTAHPKSLPATGFNVGGLVMADDVGLRVLRGQYDGWDERVVVCEGEPDYLTWATRGGKWATFGVVAGSWTKRLAARIPDGCRVAVRVHADENGRKYAKPIMDTLAGRCAAVEAT